MEEKDKNDGYKFAIAFLAASGSIFYATYNYLQNMPIRAESFVVLCLMLVCMLISIICFLTYILIKEYLMNTKNGDSTKILNKLAQVLYKFALGFFAFPLILFILIFLCILMCRCFTELLQAVGIPSIVSYYASFVLSIITFLVCYVVVVYSHLFPNQVAMIRWTYVLGIIVFAVLLLGVISYTPLHGHVTMDMESVYYKNNTPIPVSIQVTGPNTEIGVFLYTKNSSNSSALRGFLGGMEPDFFGQESDDVLKRKLYSDKVSVGSYLGNGKYCVFINTTSLPAGYYELICIRKGFWKETCEGKSFYLVNKNQQ